MTPFNQPPQITNASGLVGQAAAAAQAAGTSANSAQSIASTAASDLRCCNGWRTCTTDYNTFNSMVNSRLGQVGHRRMALYTAVKTPLSYTTGYNDSGCSPTSRCRSSSSSPCSRVRRDPERGPGRRTYRATGSVGAG